MLKIYKIFNKVFNSIENIQSIEIQLIEYNGTAHFEKCKLLLEYQNYLL